MIEFLYECNLFEKYEFNNVAIFDKSNVELSEFVFHRLGDRYYDFTYSNMVRKIWVIFDTIRNKESMDISFCWHERKIYEKYPKHNESHGDDAEIQLVHLMRYLRILEDT